MITTAQLRTFDALARHRHFTRAAEELLIAQPSVTYQVHELERALGVRLVDVVARKVHLTDAGERLAERAAALLNELEDTEREMRSYGVGEAGRLRLGATRTVGGYALPAALVEFIRSHPNIEVQLTIENSPSIESLLLRRSIDLAVVEWKFGSPRLASRPLRRDSLVLIAPRGHELTDETDVLLDQLRGQRFVMREVGSGTRALTEQALRPVLDDIQVVLELDQPEAIVRAVEAGLGLAFVSRSIVERHLQFGALRVITVDGIDLWRDFSLVMLREHLVSPAMRAFDDFITKAWCG
jgi:DNA-binding transcriptional LysR family regulator